MVEVPPLVESYLRNWFVSKLKLYYRNSEIFLTTHLSSRKIHNFQTFVLYSSALATVLPLRMDTSLRCPYQEKIGSSEAEKVDDSCSKVNYSKFFTHSLKSPGTTKQKVENGKHVPPCPGVSNPRNSMPRCEQSQYIFHLDDVTEWHI